MIPMSPLLVQWSIVDSPFILWLQPFSMKLYSPVASWALTLVGLVLRGPLIMVSLVVGLLD